MSNGRVAEPSTESTAMTRAASSAVAITTPEAYATQLAEWQQHFNVLTPFSTFSHLAPGWGISGTVVPINPDPAAGDVYAGLPFLKGNERAIAKKGLRKLAEGAGVSTQTYEVTTAERYHWKVKAIATYRGIDGAQLTREATKEWDLRDGSPQMRGWTQAQILEARKHGLRNCEARAINAAIRECGCGIDQKYSVEQLRKPFVAIRVSYQPDYSDPEIRRMVAQNALGATAALYAGPAAPLRAIPDDEGVDEPRHVGSSSSVAASTSGSAPSAATSAGDRPANPDEPPCEGAVRIVKVEPKPGEKNGRKYVRFLITDSNGVEHSTFDTSIKDAAEKAKATNAWVEVIVEQNGQYKNLVEIAPAGQSPGLFDGDQPQGGGW